MWTNVATVNKIAIFPKLTIVSNDLATLNSKSSFIDSCAVGGRVLVFHRCKLLLPETRLKIPG